MELRDRIWKVMKVKGIPTYYALAKVTNIPMVTLRDFLLGKTKNITFENVEKIAKAINISIAELIGEKEERYSGKVKELADMASQLNPTQLESLIFTAKTFLETYKEMAATTLKREESMEISYT